MLTLVLANVLGLLVGFMLGVLIRSSAGALVAYFVYSFLLPTVSIILANSQDWFRHLQPWVDFQYAAGTLIDGTVTSEQWAHIATSATVWLALPLVVGLGLVDEVGGQVAQPPATLAPTVALSAPNPQGGSCQPNQYFSTRPMRASVSCSTRHLRPHHDAEPPPVP